MWAPFSPLRVRTSTGFSSEATTAPLLYPEIMSAPAPVLHSNGRIAVDGEDDMASLYSSHPGHTPAAATNTPTTAASAAVTPTQPKRQHQKRSPFSSTPQPQQKSVVASPFAASPSNNRGQTISPAGTYPRELPRPSLASYAPSAVGSQAQPPSHIGVAYDDDDDACTIVIDAANIFDVDVPVLSTTPLSGITAMTKTPTAATAQSKEQQKQEVQHHPASPSIPALVESCSFSSCGAVAPASPSGASSSSSEKRKEQEPPNTPRPLSAQPIQRSPKSVENNNNNNPPIVTAEEYLGTTKDVDVIDRDNHHHQCRNPGHQTNAPDSLQKLKMRRKGATVMVGIAGGVAGFMVLGPVGGVAGGVGSATATRIIGKRIEKRLRKKLDDAQACINLKSQSETSSFS